MTNLCKAMRHPCGCRNSGRFRAEGKKAKRKKKNNSLSIDQKKNTAGYPGGIVCLYHLSGGANRAISLPLPLMPSMAAETIPPALPRAFADGVQMRAGDALHILPRKILIGALVRVSTPVSTASSPSKPFQLPSEAASPSAIPFAANGGNTRTGFAGHGSPAGRTEFTPPNPFGVSLRKNAPTVLAGAIPLPPPARNAARSISF